MTYTGESCDATNTSQQSDKYDCSGDPQGDNQVYIVVNSEENNLGGEVYFTGNVDLGGVFTASASNAGQNKLNSKTFFHIFDYQGGTEIQLVEIHASCSAPVVLGDQVGSLIIVNAIFENGFECGPIPPVDVCEDIEQTITYNWSVVDECGLTDVASRTITIKDINPPVSCDPLDKTIECVGTSNNENEAQSWNESNIALLESCATDDCTNVYVTSNYSFGNFVPGCGNTGSLIVTYVISDDCGNSIEKTATFTIEDTNPPFFDGLVPDVTISCNDPIEWGTPAFLDHCGDVSITDTNTTESPGICTGEKVLTRTWTITDDCGLEAQTSAKITVIDNTPPTASDPDPITVECFDEIPNPDPKEVTDEYDTCDDNPTVTFVSDNITSVPCTAYETTVTRTYRVTDCSGNTKDVYQEIIIDNDPPLITCPADKVVDCFSNIYPGTPNFRVACTLNPVIEISDPVLVEGDADCPGAEYEVTYTVEDACGRTAYCVQTFTIHNDGPTIVCPDDQTVECASDIVEGTPTTTTTCGMEKWVTTSGPTLVSGQADCPGAKYEIEYTVEDACGRTAYCVQTFTIHNDGPTIVCPDDQTVECASDIVEGTPTTTTSCGMEKWVTTSGPTLVSGEADCPGAKYEIEYTVEDACGRTAYCVQTFTIHNDGPTIICPDDQTVECASDIVEGTPTSTTSCGMEKWVTTSGPTLVSGDADCYGAKYEIIYTVEDACGRTKSYTQTFTIDNDGPTIVCPDDQTVECESDIVEGTPTTTTSCGMEKWVTTSGPTLVYGQADCPGAKYEIVYTVEDACGRTKSCTQTFTDSGLNRLSFLY